MKMKQIIYKYANDKGLLLKDEKIAVNKLEIINEKEVVLSGNKLGLIMLADYLLEIALSEGHNHIHLDANNFFNDAQAELIIEKNE